MFGPTIKSGNQFAATGALITLYLHTQFIGHITTFGGHPVCCAAGLAAAHELMNFNLIDQVEKKAQLFKEKLIHPKIKSIRNCGLLFAIQFDSSDYNLQLNKKLIEKGLLVDWFLFASDCLRIAPPLIISDEEISDACEIIVGALNEE